MPLDEEGSRLRVEDYHFGGVDGGGGDGDGDKEWNVVNGCLHSRWLGPYRTDGPRRW
ncbi:hypothetical protein FRC18_008314, partial [Serendipita sp. 400]